MSKYTEAIADILGLIKPTTIIFEEEKESLWTAVEALQIADRLEQADATKCEENYCNYDDSEYGQGYENGFEGGYNTALADIRGDAE